MATFSAENRETAARRSLRACTIATGRKTNLLTPDQGWARRQAKKEQGHTRTEAFFPDSDVPCTLCHLNKLQYDLARQHAHTDRPRLLAVTHMCR